jgi:hypothetical protein
MSFNTSPQFPALHSTVVAALSDRQLLVPDTDTSVSVQVRRHGKDGIAIEGMLDLQKVQGSKSDAASELRRLLNVAMARWGVGAHLGLYMRCQQVHMEQACGILASLGACHSGWSAAISEAGVQHTFIRKARFLMLLTHSLAASSPVPSVSASPHLTTQSVRTTHSHIQPTPFTTSSAAACYCAAGTAPTAARSCRTCSRSSTLAVRCWSRPLRWC